MQKSKTLFLVINLFFLISCKTNDIVSNYKSIELKEKEFSNVYFSNQEIDYVYKTNITIYGKEISGIFIIKKINSTQHRIVFTTDFGNKLMDFERSENDFKINYIVDELNKKIVINTLKKDFDLLLKNNFFITQKFENELLTVYKSDSEKQYNYLFIDKKSNQLLKIINSTKRKEKIVVNFSSENNIFANHIIFQHYNIQLKIELNYLKQTN